MDREPRTLTLAMMQDMVTAGKARNADFREIQLTPALYTELKDNLKESHGMDLPAVDAADAVILLGIRIKVWRPAANARTLTARGHTPPG